MKKNQDHINSVIRYFNEEFPMLERAMDFINEVHDLHDIDIKTIKKVAKDHEVDYRDIIMMIRLLEHECVLWEKSNQI